MKVQKPDNFNFAVIVERTEEPLPAFEAPQQAATRSRSLVGQAMIVAGISALGLLLAVVYAATAPRLYSASSLLLISDARRDVTPSSSTSIDSPANAALIENQIEIMRSNGNLRRVADELELASFPEFGGGGRLIALTGMVKAMLGLAPPAEEINLAEQKSQAAVDRLRDGLAVKRLGLSHLLEVSFRSPSPERAARVANRVVELFIADQLEQDLVNYGQEISQLQARLAQLGKRAFEAELAAQAAKNTISNQTATEGGAASGSGFSARQAKLMELESIARATRIAYEAMAQRAAEVTDSGGPVGRPVHVISPAVPPARPNSPNIVSVLLLGLLLGVASGVSAVMLRSSLASRKPPGTDQPRPPVQG